VSLHGGVALLDGGCASMPELSVAACFGGAVSVPGVLAPFPQMRFARSSVGF